MSARTHDINDEFGVGFEFDLTEAAFPSSESMPQFLPSEPSPKFPLSAAVRPSINAYPPMLLNDLAMGLDDTDTICARHGLTPAELEKLFTVRAFKKELSYTAQALREEGSPFRVKARLQAEHALEKLDQMIYDPETPANIVLSAIQSLVKWGGLEPKPDKAGDQGPPQQVNIQILIPNYA